MKKKRVLIPSDNVDLVSNLALGYAAHGYDVVAGSINFELQSGEFDVVHILWPEELTGWQLPTPERVRDVTTTLMRWRDHARIVVSANNLYPHRSGRHDLFRQLYVNFYRHADAIHHFSCVSKTLVTQEYREIAGANHVVRVGFNYARLLPSSPIDRAEARKSFGLNPTDTVFLSFGALRSWDEVSLLRQAFDKANVRGKKLLLSSQFSEDGPIWKRRWHRWLWKHWRTSDAVIALDGRIPEKDLSKLFSAADAVLVVRQHSMSSGIPSLAMTFGRFVISPELGAMQEYLNGTGNCLYEAGSVDGLAAAMETASTTDREKIGRANADIAAGWGWDQIVGVCLDALAQSARLAKGATDGGLKLDR